MQKLQKAIKRQEVGNHDRKLKQKFTSKYSDERIELLKLEWFKDKKVLDIGCNDGIIDLMLTTKFEPRMLIGIDVDHRMVKKAIRNLQHAFNDEEQTEIICEQILKSRADLNKEDQEMYDAIEQKK